MKYIENIIVNKTINRDIENITINNIKYDSINVKQFLLSLIIIYNKFIDENKLHLLPFFIRKSNKKKRFLISQSKYLKYILKPLERILSGNYNFKSSTIGFIRNKNVRKNISKLSSFIKKDKNNMYILKIDIKDYFNSITKKLFINIIKEEKLFNNILDEYLIKYIPDVLFAGQDNLLQGLTTSPFISNVVGEYTIDKALNNIIKQYGIKSTDFLYYRYADDLILVTRNIKIDKQFILENMNKYIKIYTDKYDINCNIIINENKIHSNSYSEFIKKTYKILGVSIYDLDNTFTGTAYEQRLKYAIHKNIMLSGKLTSPRVFGLLSRYKDVVKNKKKLTNIYNYIRKQQILYTIKYNDILLKDIYEKY